MTSLTEQWCSARLSAIAFGLDQAPSVVSGSDERCSRTSTHAEAFLGRARMLVSVTQSAVAARSGLRISFPTSSRVLHLASSWQTRHAGVAPIPVWSGNTAGRVRMTRSGNRQLNAALHRIAVTQIRLDGLGQTYYRKRLADGDSNPEALRCLKRRIARVVFHHLHTDHNTRHQPCQPAAA
jgi:hypothetical protein